MQIESGVQLFSRVCSSTFNLTGINKKLFKDGGPHQNKTIEVFGVHSNKLIVDFLIRCILPKDLNEEWKELEVIFVSTVHQINIICITNALDAILKDRNIKDRRSVIETALRKITILKCYNSEQTRLSLRNLEKLVARNENICLLIVDNIAGDYWLEKQSQPMLSFENYCKINLKILQDIVRTMNLVLIFSRYEIGSSSPNLTVDYRIDCSDGKKFAVYNTELNKLDIISVELKEFIKFV